MCLGNNQPCENSDDNPGITGVCPQRDNCYRFTATPNPYRQSYFVVTPFTEEGCRYFSSNKD